MPEPSDQTSNADVSELRQKLFEHVNAIKVCMFTTLRADGSLDSRPMTTLQIEPDGTLWFFLPPHSEVAVAVGANSHVNVSYAEHGEGVYATLRGSAYLVDDPEKAEELWNELAATWFPEGVSESRLLRVDVQEAQYWRPQGTTFGHFLSVAKAALTNTIADDGEHRTVRF